MDLELNNLQRSICHKTQQLESNQAIKFYPNVQGPSPFTIVNKEHLGRERYLILAFE